MKFKRLSLLLISILTTIPACSGAGAEVEETNKQPTGTQYLESLVLGEAEIHEGDFEPIDLGETTSHEILNPDLNLWTFKDVEPNFIVHLTYDTNLLAANDIKDLVDIKTSVVDEEVKFSLEKPVGAEFENIDNVLAITPNPSYEPGKGYSILLNQNAAVHFYQKSEDIKKIIFTVKDEEHENVDLKTTFPTYPLSKVSNNTGFNAINPCLTYDGLIDQDVGAVVCFSDDPTNKLIDTLYCKIVSKSVSSGVTTLYYNAPDVDQIFNECDAHYEDHGLDLENNYTPPDEENIRQELLNSEPVLISLMQVANDYDFSDNGAFIDFLKTAKLNFVFKGKGSTLSIQITISCLHKFTEGVLKDWVLKVCLSFEFQRTYNVSCDVGLKKVAGIPVGVDASFGLSEDTTYTTGLKLNLISKSFDQEVDVDEPPESTSWDEARRMVDTLSDQFENEEVQNTVKQDGDGTTTSILLGAVAFNLGIVTIEFDIYFCITIEISGNFVFGWSKSDHTNLVSYSSSSGGSSDAGNSSSQKSFNTINVALFVRFNFEIFLRLEVYVYITGLKAIFNLELSADIGIYITVMGLGELDWDLSTGKTEGSFGFSIEFGYFFRVYLSVNILTFINLNWELYNRRFPLFKFDTLLDIKSHVQTTIELSTIETKIGQTALLTFNVFDGINFTMRTHTYGVDEENVVITSVFFGDLGYKVIKKINTDNPAVTIDDDKIKVDKTVAETSGNFSIEYCDSVMGGSKFCYVPFHYLSKDAHFVTFDDQNKVAHLKGDVISFPAPEEKAGYVFEGWYLDNVRVDMSKPQYMPDNDINYVSRFVPLKYYSVYYYDANMKLVYTEKVQEGYPALGPDAATRDRFMGSNYVFVGWDKDLSCIKENTKTYGIYIKVGQGND